MLSVNTCIEVSQTLMTEVGQNFLFNLILKSEEEMRCVFDDKDNFCQFFIKKTILWVLIKITSDSGAILLSPQNVYFL